MGEIKFVGSMVMIALFVVAIIGYVTDFGVDNNSVVKLSNTTDEAVLTSNVRADLLTYKDQTNGTTSKAFFQTEPEQASTDTTISGGVFKGGVSGAFSSVKTIIGYTNDSLFGGDIRFGIFLTTLVAFLTFVSVLYIWKTWKGGSPD